MAGRRRLVTMARRRHTPEQIIRKLREADRLLAEGADIADVARHLEVAEQTYHRWRNQFGGMKADDARRLKELEIDALREVAKGNW
jgi:putative transposase